LTFLLFLHSILERLMKEFPGKYGFSVSHTTRKPRKGEEDGVAYNFVSRDAFLKEVEANKFIEWAEYAGNCYGTSVDAVKRVQEAGQIVLLDIDMQGVQSVKALGPKVIDAYYIMFVPPSVEELERRLKGRGDTSPQAMRKRLDTAKAELVFAEKEGYFDCVIVSGDLDETYQSFLKAMKESQKGCE